MDIVERLRLPEAVLDGEICHEAADEIERLRRLVAGDVARPEAAATTKAAEPGER